MAEYNEATAMQGVAERFAKAAEELRLTGRQLFRDGIVANDQVLSKIKKGWQKPTKKAIELFCQKYGVSAAWMYTGEGNQYLPPWKQRGKGHLQHGLQALHRQSGTASVQWRREVYCCPDGG